MSDEKPAKSGKGKLIIIIVVALLVVLAGGGAAAYFLLLKPKAKPSAEEVAAQQEKATHFIALEPFVTNVQSQDGATHYLQVKVELKTSDPKLDDKVKEVTPELRNVILRILAAQQADKVSSVQVRERLRWLILIAVNQVLTGGEAAVHLPPLVAPAPAASGASAPKPAGSGPVAPVTIVPPVEEPAPKGPVSGVYFDAFVVQ